MSQYRLYRILYGWPDWVRRLVAYLLVVITFCGIAVKLYEQDQTQNRESKERIHQLCLVFEGEHKEDVDQLARTYAYVVALTDEELKTTLNRFVLAQLPITEKRAQTDAAPQFCDKPDVGLAEPDPEIPKRPERITEALAKSEGL